MLEGSLSLGGLPEAGFPSSLSPGVGPQPVPVCAARSFERHQVKSLQKYGARLEVETQKQNDFDFSKELLP